MCRYSVPDGEDCCKYHFLTQMLDRLFVDRDVRLLALGDLCSGWRIEVALNDGWCSQIDGIFAFYCKKSCFIEQY